jgi:hypothetical protein
VVVPWSLSRSSNAAPCHARRRDDESAPGERPRQKHNYQAPTPTALDRPRRRRAETKGQPNRSNSFKVESRRPNPGRPINPWASHSSISGTPYSQPENDAEPSNPHRPCNIAKRT